MNELKNSALPGIKRYLHTSGKTKNKSICFLYETVLGGDRGVMVIVVGNGHGDTSSNPGLG